MTIGKRCFDILAALLGLILLCPLFLAFAILIRCDSRGPVFFRGARVGRDGILFFILKFRTMTADAGQRGAGITTRNDPRITRIGQVLRRYKLDELPQLWNVLRGEMSLVGPRPEDPRYVTYYTSAQRKVLTVPPGITGVAALAFRHEQDLLDGAVWEEKYVREIMPAKLELELAYLQRRTFWSDLQILGRTALALLD
jgi:lipopolysaccharide/colanic/teichoic acid biosynthesis glycosyltransferase